MNRRRFLELMTKAVAGSAVAYSFPSTIVPKNIVQPVRLTDVFPDGIEVYAYGVEPLMRGIPYIVSNSGDYFGLARDTLNRMRHATDAEVRKVMSVNRV